MTNPLEEAREALAQALREPPANLHAFSVIPDQASPPLAYVAPGDPYLSWDELSGASFGEAVLHHQVVLVAAAGVGQARVPELEVDVLIAVQALDALDGTDVTSVGGFFAITLTGSGQHMACAVETRTYISLDA